METLPEDAAAPPPTRLQPPQPYLFLLLEAQRPLAGSSRHALGGIGEVLIGRGNARAAERAERRLTLTLPDPWLSTAHARLEAQGGAWRVTDLGSRNGLHVDGVRCDEAELRDGALVEVGHSFFLFRSALAGTRDQPLDAATESGGGELVTQHPVLARELGALAQVALSPVAVLIGGETGTGKELAARAVHQRSGRKGSFIAVNCGALPATLVESELFGSRRGAYSGALDRPGLVRAADGGTLFLDEIGDLPLPAQAALLRVIHEREVMPIGGTQAHKVDLRVVAATHRDLEELVARAAFRADLHARLAGFTLTLPPLRERREDLGLIIGALFARAGAPQATLSVAAARALLLHPWPSNVRGLEQRLHTALALAGGSAEIHAEHLGALGAAAPKRSPASRGDDEAEAALRATLVEVMTRHAGNISEVAREMKRSRVQVHRWLRRFGIDARAFRRR